MNRTPLALAVFKDGRRQRELAAACRLSPGHLSQILSGKRQPKISTALRLAAVLNADAAELFNAELYLSELMREYNDLHERIVLNPMDETSLINAEKNVLRSDIDKTRGKIETLQWFLGI